MSMPSNHRSTCPHSQPLPSTLYFAYGSNMSVAQMAQRCPGSIFKGPAILDMFRWHINERGVANVLQSDSNHAVEGLLYMVTPKDETVLDRNEGVSRGFYQKRLITVSFQPHGQYTDFKTTRLASLMKQWRDEIGDNISHDKTPRRSPWFKAKVLVYVSEDYARDGQIRGEYIPRMQDAVNDAVFLGVSKQFANRYIVPFLHIEHIHHLATREHKQEQKKLIEKRPEQMNQDGVIKRARSQENKVKLDAENYGAAAHDSVTEKDANKAVDLFQHGAEDWQFDYCTCGFPADMLDAVDKVGRYPGDICDYYVIAERRTRVDTSASIVVNAGQPRLANEAAMKEFTKIRETEGKSAVVSFEAPDVVVVEEGPPGELEWKLEHGRHLRLECTRLGEPRPWLIVRVEQRPFSCL